MNVDLSREDLETLVKGTCPTYDAFKENLVQKAGCSIDGYGRTVWKSLNALNDEELYNLYQICK